MDRDVAFGLDLALDSWEFGWVEGWELFLWEDEVDEVFVEVVGVELEMRDFVLLDSLYDCSAPKGYLKFGFDECYLKLQVFLLELSLFIPIRLRLKCFDLHSLIDIANLLLPSLDLKLYLNSLIGLKLNLNLISLDELIFGIQ